MRKRAEDPRIPDPSRRLFLKSAALTAAAIVTGQATAFMPEQTEAANLPLDPELDRILTQEETSPKRKAPPRYFFVGDGNHLERSNFDYMTREETIATFARHGVRAVFIEKPFTMQNLIDHLASGAWTAKAYAREHTKMAYATIDGKEHTAPDSHVHAEADLILRCKKYGISVFAIDRAGSLDDWIRDTDAGKELLQKMIAFQKQADNASLSQSEVQKRFIEAHPNELQDCLNVSVVEYRLNRDPETAALALGKMKAFGPEAKGLFIYGMEHGDHALAERGMKGRIRSRAPSIVGMLGGPEKVARLALPRWNEAAFGALPDWTILPHSPAPPQTAMAKQAKPATPRI